MSLRAEAFGTIKDHRLVRLLTYWVGLRGQAAMPARRRFDPVAVPFILPHVWLCDYIAESGRFQYRLLGDRVREVYDTPVAHYHLDEVTDKRVLPRVTGYFRRCVTDPCIVHVHGKIYSELERPARGERLLLPLASDGVTPDGILGATIATWDNWRAVGGLLEPIQHRTFYPLDGGPADTESSP